MRLSELQERLLALLARDLTVREVALLMALQRATLAGGTGESVYATRGLRTL